MHERRCEICQTVIDPERVDAIPDTRLCTMHAKAIQEFGGEFTVTGTLEKTSKEGSLKKNYGGVSTSRTRNTSAIARLKDAYAKGK